MSKPVRAVYDCMILVQAAARPARTHATFQLARNHQVELCISPAILEEVSDVLTRPEVQAKFSELKPPVAAAFLEELRGIAIMVGDVPEVFHLPRDPKDEPYVNLAIAVQPCSLVTWNQRHLTYLMDRNTPEGIGFCQRFPGVVIADPPAFVQHLKDRVR